MIQYVEAVLIAAMLWVWYTERQTPHAADNSPLTPREIPKALMLHMVPHEDNYDMILCADGTLPDEHNDLGQPQQSMPIVDLTEEFAVATDTTSSQDPWKVPNFFAVFHRAKTDALVRQIQQHKARLVRPEQILAVENADSTAVIGALVYTNLVATHIVKTPMYRVSCSKNTASSSPASTPDPPGPTPGTPQKPSRTESCSPRPTTPSSASG